ncbi:16S rRNA (adenine(1518)-N(6)/adenine(1519)-N(6))-dimethyltransferase RsmA [Clostridium hydrogenum]|uniref:16S rRNA (adenine(1518)-N(6)/adenine(1519)-N(6))- dimethyltransferase RsmA n=1 Tax=Clostridium hydrogenum TaxID=2855764 RepID=UPI001F3879D1|nr:16S rRNA (adenine(1518)-N(6)/adenine(1519)-N(6))-dimethyltransferase RsmA [Clostridium hydrogenum]
MEKLNTLDVVKKHGFKFSKSLGQNFLTDSSVLEDIVNSAEISKEDFVIEIGPGVGTLTKKLIEKAKYVCAIEIDSTLLPIIQEEIGEVSNFRIINSDALKLDFNEIIGNEKSVKLVANLPYYVTTPIISKLLNGEYNFKSLTVMIQKEVADRINAAPNCKEYGALSILVQYYCNTSIVRVVKPSCFVPQPKVDSTVIKLDKLENPRVKVHDTKLFFRVVRDAFNMRRKTLWNAMKQLGISSDNMISVFERAEVDPKRRGETLSIEEFARLADEIHKEL